MHMKEEIGVYKFILVILFIITISLFSFWGYQWVNYVLSRMFSVDTGSTFYDLFVGLIAMISSIPIFCGSAMAWKNNRDAFLWLTIGSVGFFLKNGLEIINTIDKLTLLKTVNSFNIQQAATDIGWQLFQVAFWIFIIIYFKKKLLASQESNLIQ